MSKDLMEADEFGLTRLDQLLESINEAGFREESSEVYEKEIVEYCKRLHRMLEASAKVASDLSDKLDTSPDAPELVRYDIGRHDVVALGSYMNKSDYGEYVRYDQAAAMITAEISRERHLHQKQLSEVTERLTGDYLELLAKLAQINEQEPVGYGVFCKSTGKYNHLVVACEDAKSYIVDGLDELHPLYAAPVVRDTKCFECESDLTVTCLKCNASSEATHTFKQNSLGVIGSDICQVCGKERDHHPEFVTSLAETIEQDKWRNAALGAVAAWEALPGGRNYDLRTIARWVQGPMYEAIRTIRALSGKEPS